MASVTLPYNLTAGSPENVANLMSNLNALKDGVNTIDTAQLAAGAVTPAKLAASVPLGYVGQTKLTSNTTSIGASYVDLTGGSLTFTAAANRYYCLSAMVMFAVSGADAYAQLDIREGSTTLTYAISSLIQDTASATVACSVIVSTFGAGSHTIKLSAKRAIGNGSIATAVDTSSKADFLLVEDIGGV